MQRSTEEIVDWNIKKIQSKASGMQKRLTEVSQKTRNGQINDILEANAIVSNMTITIEQLEYDMDRLLLLFSDGGIRTAERLEESPRSLDVNNRSKSVTDLASHKRLSHASDTEHTDSLALKEVVKQIKTLEGIVLSGNITERIGKLEREPTTKNILSRLDIVEKHLLHANLPHRVEVLEKGTVVEVRTRLEKVETLAQQTVKGVFGDDSSNCSRNPCVVSQLSNMENELNEGKARIHGMEEKLNKMESTVAQQKIAVPAPKVEAVAVLKDESDDEDEDWDTRSVACSEVSLSGEKIRFSAVLEHDGPWENGIVIKDVKEVKYNEGNAFDSYKCRFEPPVDGNYRITLKIRRSDSGTTKIEVWESELLGGGWVSCLFQVELYGGKRFKFFTKVFTLTSRNVYRLRVFGGTPFDSCVFESKLLK